MKPSIKLLKCFNCQNVNNNLSNAMSSLEYCGLHEINCSRCKTKWLVCPIHELRWSRLRYRQAQFHVTNMHNSKASSSETVSFNNLNVCLGDDHDITTISDIGENLVSDDTDISSQCNDVNDDSRNDKFTLCHREVSFENYSEKSKDFYYVRVVTKAMV